MLDSLIGFIIALTVGLTGIGAGSFTVPALVLIVGLDAGEAVGTAFLFAGALRLIAAPFYMLERQINTRYLGLLLSGAVPGLLVGICTLQALKRDGGPTVIILLGSILIASSAITFIPKIQNPGFAQKNSRWLPWLAVPIGVESGFSSAGAGALGMVLLLNYSELPPAQAVGTDLLFGLALAILGSAFHWIFGSVSSSVLFRFLIGGIPGVVLGCALAPRVPVLKLKKIIATVAILTGLQLMWAGFRATGIRAPARNANVVGQEQVTSEQLWDPVCSLVVETGSRYPVRNQQGNPNCDSRIHLHD